MAASESPEADAVPQADAAALPARMLVGSSATGRNVPDRTWDVLVAGAGPAGAIAAARLASGGRSVLLIDRRRFPREKVCGDCIAADAFPPIERAGAWDAVRSAAHEVRAVTIISPSGYPINIPGRYLMLKRSRFDTIIARRAVEAGATFCLGEVRDVRSLPDATVAVRVACTDRSGLDREIRARLCLVATGAAGALPRGLGLVGLGAHAKPSAVGVRCYVRSRHRIDGLIGVYDREMLPGYAWIFPMGAGVYNVGCAAFFGRGGHGGRRRRGKVNLVERFESFLRRFGPARELLCSGERLTPLRGATLRCGMDGARVLGKGGVLGAGEAVGATLPYTGGGIGKALITGELAASAMDRALATGDLGELAAYPVEVSRTLAPVYRGYKAAARWLSIASVSDFVARRMGRSRSLSTALVRVTAGECNAREVFSLRALARSFLR